MLVVCWDNGMERCESYFTTNEGELANSIARRRAGEHLSASVLRYDNKGCSMESKYQRQAGGVVRPIFQASMPVKDIRTKVA